MSDPQIWSIIGVLTAFVVGTVGLMYKLIDARFESFEAVMVARFDGVDQRFDGVSQQFRGVDQRFDGVSQQFRGVSQRFDGVSQRFDSVDRRLDVLETDMSLVKAHLLGVRRPNGA